MEPTEQISEEFGPEQTRFELEQRLETAKKDFIDALKAIHGDEIDIFTLLSHFNFKSK